MIIDKCWKEDAILRKIQREQMDKDVEDLLAIGDEFKNRRSVVCLLDLPFPAEQSPPIINNRTI